MLRQQRPRSIVDVLEAVGAQLHSSIPADALWVERDGSDQQAGSLGRKPNLAGGRWILTCCIGAMGVSGVKSSIPAGDNDAHVVHPQNIQQMQQSRPCFSDTCVSTRTRPHPPTPHVLARTQDKTGVFQHRSDTWLSANTHVATRAQGSTCLPLANPLPPCPSSISPKHTHRRRTRHRHRNPSGRCRCRTRVGRP